MARKEFLEFILKIRRYLNNTPYDLQIIRDKEEELKQKLGSKR